MTDEFEKRARQALLDWISDVRHDAPRIDMVVAAALRAEHIRALKWSDARVCGSLEEHKIVLDRIAELKEIP